MDFRILGPLEVSEHGRSVALGGPKQRSVLALLLLHANETVSVDRIVAALWDDPPPTAIKSIQMRVSSLRKDLGADRVRTRAPGYVLRVAPGELDLSRFRDLVDAARAADPADAAGMLADALALWRGDPLADLAYEPFAQAHAAQLEELQVVLADHDGRQVEIAGRDRVADRPVREAVLGVPARGSLAEAGDSVRRTTARAGTQTILVKPRNIVSSAAPLQTRIESAQRGHRFPEDRLGS